MAKRLLFVRHFDGRPHDKMMVSYTIGYRGLVPEDMAAPALACGAAIEVERGEMEQDREFERNPSEDARGA